MINNHTMHEIDLDKCVSCTETRCDLAFLQKTPKEIQKAKEEEIYQRITKERYNAKIKAYYIKETKYYKKFIKEEDELTNYDRMNKTDRLHQRNWDLGMSQLIRLQENYYNNIKY